MKILKTLEKLGIKNYTTYGEHIAKVDENITIQEGEDLLNQLTTENLKECLSGILNDLSKKYAGMDFKTINGTLKALFKKLKPNWYLR